MPRNKIPLVLQVALADKEAFKILPNRKEAKRIYDRARNKLVRRGLEGTALDYELVNEIRHELFKLQKPTESKESKSQIKEDIESDFFERKNFRIHGVDVWGEHAPEINPIQKLENNYNRSVKEGFRDVFCPVCKCNPCRCHE